MPAAPTEASSPPASLPAPGAEGVLYLVDISGYVFRAYHALPPLSSSKGEPTHAVLGTVNMLQKVVNERRPHMLAVAMDSRGPTFRHGHRRALQGHAPGAAAGPLASRWRAARRSCARTTCPSSSGRPRGRRPHRRRWFARALGEGWRVVIVSADKDLMQLVRDDDERVVLWDSMRDKRLRARRGAREVRRRARARCATSSR